MTQDSAVQHSGSLCEYAQAIPLTEKSIAEAQRVATALLTTPISEISEDDLGYVARIIQRLCLEISKPLGPPLRSISNTFQRPA